MSIVDPTRIIRLMAELTEQLSAWNIRISESLRHAEAVRNEHGEVARLAEKEWVRAVDTAEKDAEATQATRSMANDLYQRSSHLFHEVEQLREAAGRRARQAAKSLAYWLENEKKSRDWHKVAEAEYERAIEEYNQAVEEYNAALAKLEQAEERLRECRNRQTIDRNGRTTPSCENQYQAYRRWEKECTELRARVEERKTTLEEAEDQRVRAAEALDLAVKSHREATRLAAQSNDMLAMSNVAYRAAADAVSAARSALFIVDRSTEKNERQQALNDESGLCYSRIAESVQTVGAALASVSDLSENGNRLNALLASDLEYKSNILYRLSNLTASDLPVFNTDKK